MIKLTQYSHGAGCGCKISPAILSQMLAGSEASTAQFTSLIVGNMERDDAAVFDIGNGMTVISTTDFFMPIVDDPFTFGQIAAANAISDIYAMGGKPIMAIAILGWPVDKLGPEVAAQVIQGGRDICTKAGIPLAGGHSIDAPEPIFGLAVTGTAPISHIKANRGAQAGDILYITKPLGVGIITTAQKKGLVSDDDYQSAVDNMTALNTIGELIGKLDYVHAMTDVTGFGLGGHLLEMCESSGVGAVVNLDQLPILTGMDNIKTYIDANCIPGGTKRNWASYGEHFILAHPDHYTIIADPQTSGGLLISVDNAAIAQFEALMKDNNQQIYSIGEIAEGNGIVVR